jgi:hypothetical protein
MGDAEGKPSVANDDESRLRVVAACAATIAAGWAICAATQIRGSIGSRALLWGIALFWSLFLCVFLVARALGRQKSRFVWMLVAGESLYLPLGSLLLSHLGRSRESSAVFDYSYPRSLAIISLCVLLGLAAVGYLMEPRPATPVRRSTG